MSPITKLSLLSLISQFFASNAQTGAGCPDPTCSDPNQIRFDAILDHNGEFLGGCYCACNPDLYDPNHSLYCPPPKEVNFDVQTREGDCSCGCSGATPQSMSCPGPATWNDALCECECPKQAPNGAYYPECPSPLIRDITTCDCTEKPPSPTSAPTTPTPTYGAGVPVTGTCPDGLPGRICECPHKNGPCTFNCQDGPDACKDADIQCNDGYDCTINCESVNGCSGETIMRGPSGAALTVNCKGWHSCAGDVKFLGQYGTDMTVECRGKASCKGSGTAFNFGKGMGTVYCYGYPDSCAGVEIFNLINNAQNTIGVGFECIGRYCPASAPEKFHNSASPTLSPTRAPTNMPTTAVPTRPPTGFPTATPSLRPTHSPLPTYSNIIIPAPLPVPAPPVNPINPNIPSPVTGGGSNGNICSRIGSCWCPLGIGNCDLQCTGHLDACKDGIINCNRNGYDCTVNCLTENSCSGATVMNGPIGGSLIVNCIGKKSCQGNVKFNAQFGYDLTVYCEGSEACKGNAVFNFGVRNGIIACVGYPDSCQGAQFNYNPNAISYP